MNDIIALVLTNLEKVGIGVALFMGAYIANIGLGIWKNVKIEGYEFDGKLILQSLAKFAVLIISLGLLSVVISIIPAYATYIGIEIGAETMETIDGLVVVGAFLTATIRYIGDSISKLKNILGNNIPSTK